MSNDLPDADLSAKDVLKKYENLITTNTKKNQSADILTDSPASPMAIPMFEDNNAGDEPMLSKTK